LQHYRATSDITCVFGHVRSLNEGPNTGTAGEAGRRGNACDNDAMRLGMSLASGYPGLSGADAVRALLERGLVAARAGLDHLSLGDQHATGSFSYVQNVPAIGRLMADWPADTPIGLLLLLPLWNPVLAAEQIGTLAAMSDARFIVQTGIGSGPAQFAALGAELSTRGRIADASITAMKALFAGDTVTSTELGIREASISPRPPRPVEWWIGSGGAPAAIERAAREGDAWYTSPSLDGDDLVATAASYRAACERHGRRPRIALRRDVLVGDDHDATVRLARTVIERGYRGMDGQVIAGGVEHVAERMASFAAIGVDDIVARTITVDQPTALRSIELLADVRSTIA
jgi:alkanesulfonate monooxygenase SsuD/methylene tetrahydromethanopterin reductase-like flavin-dependent oxidoreductase (luciferase family)